MRRVFLVSLLVAGSLVAQQLGDGTVYAGQPGAIEYNGHGGLATSAELDFPWGLASDSKGNLYIADSGNNRVREVFAANGDITTFAGNGGTGIGISLLTYNGQPATSVELPTPTAVAVDGSDNVYIYVPGPRLSRR
ncbi:MAG TPA: hypothetical protein VIY49_37595 [Bryobacteraceae bacterium]